MKLTAQVAADVAHCRATTHTERHTVKFSIMTPSDDNGEVEKSIMVAAEDGDVDDGSDDDHY